MADVNVTIVGYNRVERMLRRMFRRSIGLNEALLGKVGDLVAENNAAIFASDGVFGGKPWAPLTPKYAAYKIRMVGPQPILVFSGRLAGSLTSRPMSIERVTPDGMEFGTDDRTARWHQDGTSRGMPARPPVQTSAWLNHELKRLVGGHIVES